MTARGIDLARLVRYEAVEDGNWFRVGPGDGRQGQVGQQIGVVALKHDPGYEIVLHMQNGRVDTFAPMQLFLDQRPAAHKDS